MTQDVVMQDCPGCGGSASRVTQACCGNTHHGECRGHCAIPTLEPCEECNGSGQIPLGTLSNFQYVNPGHPADGLIVERLEVISIGPKGKADARVITCSDGTIFYYVEHETARAAEDYIWFRFPIPGKGRPFYNMATAEDWDKLFVPVDGINPPTEYVPRET